MEFSVEKHDYFRNATQKAASADKNVCRVRAAVCMAEKVGALLE